MNLQDKQVLIAKFNLLGEKRNWKSLAYFCLKESKGNKRKGKKLYKNLLKYYTKDYILSESFLGDLSYRLDKKKSKSKIIDTLVESRIIWM